jgi:hypothetical protein
MGSERADVGSRRFNRREAQLGDAAVSGVGFVGYTKEQALGSRKTPNPQPSRRWSYSERVSRECATPGEMAGVNELRGERERLNLEAGVKLKTEMKLASIQGLVERTPVTGRDPQPRTWTQVQPACKDLAVFRGWIRLLLKMERLSGGATDAGEGGTTVG